MFDGKCDQARCTCVMVFQLGGGEGSSQHGSSTLVETVK